MQHVGSAISFKERSGISKKDVNAGKKRCFSAKNFLGCCNSEGKFDDLKIELIESVKILDNLLDQRLWQLENYWQAQLFILSLRLHSLSD